ncbi:hypothetical protein ACFQ36_03465 [Arthrobacter sp. GCM10027362]|uniref:hypothetical protein n=1 Tax=Arthrobacter sp. GCM10027362 TaxID=3273379 RepID=UPI003640129B
MNSLRLYDSLRAAQTGLALPARTVCHTYLSKQPLIICALHLANEPGAIVGLLYGTEPDAPRVIAMGNPLNRDLRFAELARAATDIMGYLEQFSAIRTETSVRRGGPQRGTERRVETVDDCPQIITPNRATTTWLGDVLGRSLRYLRPDEQGVDPLLPILGAHLTAFAHSARTPLSHLLVPASELLSQHWTTAQLPGETENLHTMLAWISPPEGLTGREAARAAESLPPAGPEPDAAFDDQLYPAIDAWRAAVDAGADPHDASEQMRLAMHNVLLPAYQKCFAAVEVARSLPPAGHTASRHADDCKTWAWHLDSVTSGTRHFRRLLDPLGASRLLQRSETDTAEYARQQALDDPAVMDELLADGEALSGRVTFVDPTNRVGRAYRPLLRLRPDPPYPRAAGAALFRYDQPDTAAEVIEVDEHTGEVTLQLAGGMGRGQPAPAQLPAVGTVAVFTPYGRAPYFPSTLPDEIPWTHQVPTPPADPNAETGGPTIPTRVTAGLSGTADRTNAPLAATDTAQT